MPVRLRVEPVADGDEARAVGHLHRARAAFQRAPGERVNRQLWALATEALSGKAIRSHALQSMSGFIDQHGEEGGSRRVDAAQGHEAAASVAEADPEMRRQRACVEAHARGLLQEAAIGHGQRLTRIGDYVRIDEATHLFGFIAGQLGHGLRDQVRLGEPHRLARDHNEA